MSTMNPAVNGLATDHPPTGQAALARANAQRATARYQQGQTLTVTPGRLIILLYDGALRFLRRGRIALENHEIEVAHNAIRRAQDIVAELDATLDDRAGAISTNLHEIYAYLLRRLIAANLAKDGTIIDEVIAHLESLAESWRDAVAAVERTGTSGITENGVQINVGE